MTAYIKVKGYQVVSVKKSSILILFLSHVQKLPTSRNFGFILDINMFLSETLSFMS